MGPKPKEPIPVIIPDAMDPPPMAGQPGPIVAVDEKVQPAPPTTIYKPTESMAPLVDIPCVYLLERSSWPEFKRALNECGLTWNLPE